MLKRQREVRFVEEEEHFDKLIDFDRVYHKKYIAIVLFFFGCGRNYICIRSTHIYIIFYQMNFTSL